MGEVKQLPLRELALSYRGRRRVQIVVDERPFYSMAGYIARFSAQAKSGRTNRHDVVTPRSSLALGGTKLYSA